MTSSTTEAGAYKEFTFFWLSGTANVHIGSSPAIALSAAGYGQGAMAALDFYAEGDKRDEYEFIDSKWQRKAPIHRAEHEMSKCADLYCAVCANGESDRAETPAEPCEKCGETELHLAACYLNRSIDGLRRTPVRKMDRRRASDPAATTGTDAIGIVVVDGVPREAIPCPDGIAGCEVLHLRPLEASAATGEGEGETPLTIESALAELRILFPNQCNKISFHDCGEPTCWKGVRVNGGHSSPTLSEAMQKAREQKRIHR